MSATETLREMLDERGVDWEAFDDFEQTTQWSTYNGAFVYWSRERDGKLLVETTAPTKCSALCTPAQAIAITVGSDKVEAVLRKLIARLGVAADFYFARKYVDCIVEEYAGNLATLGAGTCEADETDLIPFVCADGDSSEVDYIHVMECSACGGTFEHVNGSYEFCPRCGRRIEVDE